MGNMITRLIVINFIGVCVLIHVAWKLHVLPRETSYQECIFACILNDNLDTFSRGVEKIEDRRSSRPTMPPHLLRSRSPAPPHPPVLPSWECARPDLPDVGFPIWGICRASRQPGE